MFEDIAIAIYVMLVHGWVWSCVTKCDVLLSLISALILCYLYYQEDVFSSIGRPIIDSCMHGYNGTIFA